jgi:uncharacterized protein involved in exopolysaccharide biosynthesis
MIDAANDEISLLAVINVLLSSRWKIVMTGVALALLLVGVGLLQRRHFTAQASFVPQSRTPQSASGLAAQFGLTLPGQRGDESPAFYTELLQSRGVLRTAALTQYASARSRAGRPGPATLVDAYQKPGKPTEMRVDETIKRLRKDVGSSVSAKTGMVTLNVTADSARLAQEIAARMLQLLNQFNLDRRRSQAAEERRFTQARVSEVKAELRVAEDRLQYFLQTNRDYANSPSLRFQQERLASDVALQRQLFTTLSQAFEQAKIDEVRDTPVITVVETPEVPVRPDSRRLVLKAFAGLVAGSLLGMLVAVIQAMTNAQRVHRSEEFATYTTLKREALADLKRPWRPLVRALRGRHHTVPT